MNAIRRFRFASMAQQIKKIRDITGSTISECKQAIEESKGNPELALEILKTKGLARADKKAEKAVREGAIGVIVSADRTQASLIEVPLF